MHLVYLIITPPLVFLNDPIDLKAAIPAHRMSPINTRLSSQASRAQTGLLCFILVLVEQRWQELTEPLIQIDRLQEIGQRNRLFSPRHALNGVWSAVWRSCPQIIHSTVKIHEESLSCESSQSLQVLCKQQGVKNVEP